MKKVSFSNNAFVEAQLHEDEIAYGISCCRIDKQGNKTRILPSEIDKVLGASKSDEDRYGR